MIATDAAKQRRHAADMRNGQRHCPECGLWVYDRNRRQCPLAHCRARLPGSCPEDCHWCGLCSADDCVKCATADAPATEPAQQEVEEDERAAARRQERQAQAKRKQAEADARKLREKELQRREASGFKPGMAPPTAPAPAPARKPRRRTRARPTANAAPDENMSTITDDADDGQASTVATEADIEQPWLVATFGTSTGTLLAKQTPKQKTDQMPLTTDEADDVQTAPTMVKENMGSALAGFFAKAPLGQNFDFVLHCVGADDLDDLLQFTESRDDLDPLVKAGMLPIHRNKLFQAIQKEKEARNIGS